MSPALLIPLAEVNVAPGTSIVVNPDCCASPSLLMQMNRSAKPSVVECVLLTNMEDSLAEDADPSRLILRLPGSADKAEVNSSTRPAAMQVAACTIAIGTPRLNSCLSNAFITVYHHGFANG